MNADEQRSCCEGKGKARIDYLGTVYVKYWPSPFCCGDKFDETFVTHSGSLTSSPTVQCRGCIGGMATGTTTLYGNG